MFKNMKKQQNELETIAMNLETQADKIVVKKVSFISKVLEMIMDFIYRLGKIIFWVAICLMLSIGATAICNQQIREILVNYLPF